MNRTKFVYLYIFGFICWSVLLLTRLYEIFPTAKISQVSAQIGFILHFLMLAVVFKNYTRASTNDRKILFWLIPINLGLFFNDLAFYFIIYFPDNYNLKLSFINFLIDIIPYSVWNICVLIFLLNLVREIFTSKNFIKLFSLLMLINLVIIVIFFNSAQSVFNYSSWQSVSQIATSLIELIIYNLSMLCLIYSEKKGLSFIVVGLIILVSGDFIISYSFLAQTNSIETYGELFWLLGILCIFFGMLEFNRQDNLVKNWLRSTNSIKGKLAFWAFGISIINILPFFVLAYLFFPFNKTVFLVFPPFIMITSVLVVILSLLTVKNFEIPFKKIADNIESLLLDNNKSKLNNLFVIEEFIYLQEFILKVFDIKEEKEAAKKALISLTTQVAHDIRSPIAAINTAVSGMISIPENKRTLIRNAVKRINDIANNLLVQSKINSSDDQNTIKNINDSPELIFVILDSIVAEKRYEYYNSNVKFNLIGSDCSYECFSKINLDSFKRILSNLINNSIEAVHSNGSIVIYLSCNETHVDIIIEDNGCGIPSNILPRITEQGFSFNKKTGAGLGLSYAKQYFEQINGTMQIYSEEKIGTKIHISLIRSPSPDWFCDSMHIKYGTIIAILDDDQSIHDAWNERFANIPHIKIIHFYNSSNLFEHKSDQQMPILYLVDYELLADPKNGLDVIEELNLTKKAILVTSSFEDIAIRNRCENLGVKIIPKSFVSHFKIIPFQSTECTSGFVFIDDDEAMRMAWNFAFEEAHLNITTYSSFDEFITEIDKYNINTIIYIDSDLGNQIRGELCAKNLFDKGFTQIHLATGHSKERFSNMPWIKTVVEKNPPFLLSYEKIT